MIYICIHQERIKHQPFYEYKAAFKKWINKMLDFERREPSRVQTNNEILSNTNCKPEIYCMIMKQKKRGLQV